MDITINKLDGRLVVALVGDFDNAASTKAKRNLAPVFECSDCDILIDCQQLEYISSSGLRILLNVFKHTRANGHTSTLKGMADEVKEVFELSGFLQLFRVE
jgi:anti-anti-sigma factor